MIAREAGITASDRQCGIDLTGKVREARAEIDTRTREVHCRRGRLLSDPQAPGPLAHRRLSPALHRESDAPAPAARPDSAKAGAQLGRQTGEQL